MYIFGPILQNLGTMLKNMNNVIKFIQINKINSFLNIFNLKLVKIIIMDCSESYGKTLSVISVNRPHAVTLREILD